MNPIFTAGKITVSKTKEEPEGEFISVSGVATVGSNTYTAGIDVSIKDGGSTETKLVHIPWNDVNQLVGVLGASLGSPVDWEDDDAIEVQFHSGDDFAWVRVDYARINALKSLLIGGVGRCPDKHEDSSWEIVFTDSPSPH